MASFSDSLTRMRRFLRDPDGDIWDSEQIRLYWNNSQLEIATKINYIERIHAYAYPPKWTWSYLFDHEYAYCDGDRYQALHNFGSRDIIITYPWEPGYMLSSLDYADDGSRFVHPWESEYCTPADVVKIPLHAEFNRMHFAAFDEQQIEPTTERELAEEDRFYKTTEGEVQNYYRPDEYHNEFVLYPRPGSIDWDQYGMLSDTPTDALDSGQYADIYFYSYQWDWEEDQIEVQVTGDLYACGEAWGTSYMATYEWEPDYAETSTSADTGYHLTQPWEGFYQYENRGGLVAYESDSFDEQDTGIVLDTIDADGKLLMIFEALPDEVAEETGTWGDSISWWPPYMLPVVESATLERCFGSDTEGYIPSLRDYWEMRKKIGIETIKKFKQLRLTDRDYRLGGEGKPVGRVYPRLPAGYPPI